ncbi:hypothetical protein REPUB_Repub11eG0013900 [Reevesia pubescens]
MTAVDSIKAFGNEHYKVLPHGVFKHVTGDKVKDKHRDLHEMESALKELLISFAYSLGVQGRKVHVPGEDNCLEVWAGRLSGNCLVIIFGNRCSNAATITA